MRQRTISLANSPRRRNSPSGSRDNELAKLGLQVALAERAVYSVKPSVSRTARYVLACCEVLD